MSGVFNASIFNNTVFNTGTVVPPPPAAVLRPGGDSGRKGLRRRPMYYWEYAALQAKARKKVEEAVVEELVIAEATIPETKDDFYERISHLRFIERKVAAVAQFRDLAKQIRQVYQRLEEDVEREEFEELIEFL